MPGDQKIFMQLSDGKVTVRVGGAYVPLAHWTRELTAHGEKGHSATGNCLGEPRFLVKLWGEALVLVGFWMVVVDLLDACGCCCCCC